MKQLLCFSPSVLGGSIAVSLAASGAVLLPPEHMCTLAGMQLFLSLLIGPGLFSLFFFCIDLNSEFAETEMNTAEYFTVSSVLDPYKC